MKIEFWVLFVVFFVPLNSSWAYFDIDFTEKLNIVDDISLKKQIEQSTLTTSTSNDGLNDSKVQEILDWIKTSLEIGKNTFDIIKGLIELKSETIEKLLPDLQIEFKLIAQIEDPIKRDDESKKLLEKIIEKLHNTQEPSGNSDTNKPLDGSLKINDKTPQVQTSFQHSQELTMKDMTISEFKEIVDNSTADILTADYHGSIIATWNTLYSVALGGLLGFLGSVLLELIKESKTKRKIRMLCLKDLVRLERNIRANYVMCNEIKNNVIERANFLGRIRVVTDLENLAELGTTQEFNFWHSIISSTRLIDLKAEEIGNLQSLYDLTIVYNQRIQYMINGIPAPNVPYQIVGAKQILAQQILLQQNLTGATTTLSDLCDGLMFVHQSYYDVIIGTIRLIDSKSLPSSVL